MLKSVKLSLASILLGTIGMALIPTSSFASIDVAIPQQSVVQGVSRQVPLISNAGKKRGKKVKVRKKRVSKKITSTTPKVKASKAPSDTGTTSPVVPSTEGKKLEAKPAPKK